MPVLFASKKKNKLHRLKGKSRIAQVVLVLLAVEFLFLSAFTAFNLPTATAHNWERYAIAKLHKFYCYLPAKLQDRLQADFPNSLLSAIATQTNQNIRYSPYVPQAPAAVFLGYILGWPLAAIAAVIYILLGLIGPYLKIYPFAAGSGIDYYLQPSFGYLLGMAIAAACVGYIAQGNRTSNRQLLSLLAGLLCIHGIGLSYMLGICLSGTMHSAIGSQLNWSVWLFEEARNLSWYALPYDIIFSLLLIGVGFVFRWLVTVLTAPDLGSGTIAQENLIDMRPVR